MLVGSRAVNDPSGTNVAKVIIEGTGSASAVEACPLLDRLIPMTRLRKLRITSLAGSAIRRADCRRRHSLAPLRMILRNWYETEGIAYNFRRVIEHNLLDLNGEYGINTLIVRVKGM